jgi:hypothetical protein
MNKHILFACVLTTALAGCGLHDFDLGDRITEDFRQTHPLKAGGHLTVESFNGGIEVYGWDQDSVEINGTKYAHSKDMLDSIRIEVTPSGNSLAIRADAPREMHGGNRGVRFTLHVPRHTLIDRIQSSNGGVRIEDVNGDAKLRTSNGTIRVRQFKGNLEGETSNGGVTLEQFSGSATLVTSNGGIQVSGVKGYLDARTSNGPIEASVSDMEPGRPIKLRSSNGPVRLDVDSNRLPDITATTSNASITVRLPTTASARIKAHTSNSSVRTDLALNNVTTSKTSLDGTLNGGGPVVDLSTTNGSIRLEKN